MILRDDSLRKLKTRQERLNRIHEVEDRLVKKYGIVNRDDAILFEEVRDDYYMCFNFEPYNVISINMYLDCWEIETSWRYRQYFSD